MWHLKSWSSPSTNHILWALAVPIFGWLALSYMQNFNPSSSTVGSDITAPPLDKQPQTEDSQTSVRGGPEKVQDASVSAMVGEVGGVLATPDGSMTLTIPPGALPEETKVFVETLKSPRDGGFALSYRLEPRITKFAKPVDFRFVFANLNMIDEDLEQMGAALQSSVGAWQWLGKPSIDHSERTLKVTTKHQAGSLCLARIDQLISRARACW
jgi:hypothetical protein